MTLFVLLRPTPCWQSKLRSHLNRSLGKVAAVFYGILVIFQEKFQSVRLIDVYSNALILHSTPFALQATAIASKIFGWIVSALAFDRC